VNARRRRFRDEIVTLAHGSGGKATQALVEAVFLDALGDPSGGKLPDAATLAVDASRIAFTTDAYVVKPLFFPGGDIGELSVNGTVNDLAVSGARPIALSAAFVIEEGFAVADLRRIAASMARAADVAGVAIVAGDTKVVERGKADGVYVTTSGVGVLADGIDLGPGSVRAGDQILISGSIGDHGMAVMIARGELALEVQLESDTASVAGLAGLLYPLGSELRWMRDPTRGGLATTLNELAQQSGLAVSLDELALPVKPEVAGTGEILGIDPLYVACEGRLVAVVSQTAVVRALDALRSASLGVEAAIVGEIRAEPEGLVLLQTALGGTRVVDMLVGDPLPRIC
jgi:hydrogenase expression/formation protein HypE